ncbi:MAG TPA: hypothetical protein VMZ06_07650, partial [Candidatus Bathyarchaeia archaeon]|nr:hypothetical protein [Candidatus Bathyarchaeia archaeon]
MSPFRVHFYSVSPSASVASKKSGNGCASSSGSSPQRRAYGTRDHPRRQFLRHPHTPSPRQVRQTAGAVAE